MEIVNYTLDASDIHTSARACEVIALLEEFSDIFDASTKLSSRRVSDHAFTMQPGHGPLMICKCTEYNFIFFQVRVSIPHEAHEMLFASRGGLRRCTCTLITVQCRVETEIGSVANDWRLKLICKRVAS